MTQPPNDKTLESLSSLIDGEGEAFERRRMLERASEPELAKSWHSYHLIGTAMRKEGAKDYKDLSESISDAIAQEPALNIEPTRANISAIKGRWSDRFTKAAIAASVAFAMVVGVQLFNADDAPLEMGELASHTANEPVIAAPAGFDVPQPVARNVSLDQLSDPSRERMSRQVRQQKAVFVSNTQVEDELQQLMLEHAQMGVENGVLGILPMARAAKMNPED